MPVRLLRSLTQALRKVDVAGDSVHLEEPSVDRVRSLNEVLEELLVVWVIEDFLWLHSLSFLSSTQLSGVPANGPRISRER